MSRTSIALATGWGFVITAVCAALLMVHHQRQNQAAIVDRLSSIEAAVEGNRDSADNVLKQLVWVVRRVDRTDSTLAALQQEVEVVNGTPPREAGQVGQLSGSGDGRMQAHTVDTHITEPEIYPPFFLPEDLDPVEKGRVSRNVCLVQRNSDGTLSQLRVMYDDGTRVLVPEHAPIAMELLDVSTEANALVEDFVKAQVETGAYLFFGEKIDALTYMKESDVELEIVPVDQGYAAVDTTSVVESDSYRSLRQRRSELVGQLGARNVSTSVRK